MNEEKNTVSIHNSFTFDGGPLSELLISKFLHFLWFLLDISCTVVCSGSSCDIKWWRKMKKVCTLHELHISKNIRHFSSQKAEIRCCGWPKFSTVDPHFFGGALWFTECVLGIRRCLTVRTGSCLRKMCCWIYRELYKTFRGNSKRVIIVS